MTEPDSGNADAILRLVADGSDLARPMQVDFTALIEDDVDLPALRAAVEGLGYSVEFHRDEDDDGLDCVCTRTMLVSEASVGACERELGQVLARFGAELDGWGSFGNADEAHGTS